MTRAAGGAIFIAALLAALSLAGNAAADIVTFTGGTAYLNGGGSVVTTDTPPPTTTVDYYVENGMMVDMTPNIGLVGDYYGIGNSVLHAHHMANDNISLLFSLEDGGAFDLEYLDITSNTQVGGGPATGNELTYVTASNGATMLLPTSNWGVLSDGIATLWLDPSFQNITWFEITSENAYCVGLDSFSYQRVVPEPMTCVTWLALFGVCGLAARRRKA